MNESFIIDEKLLNEAKDICKYIADESVRIRAVSGVLATKIAENIFSENFVDRESGLHNISKIVDQYDIADIYFNTAYIDVRACIDENVLLVPKAHFEYGILPKAYMFISISEDLNEGYLLGFITPDEIDRACSSDGYYIVKKESLISYYDIFTYINSNDDINNDSPENFEEQIYEFLGGNISDFKSFMINLISSKENRISFIKIANAEKLFNFVSAVDESVFDTNEAEQGCSDNIDNSENYLLEYSNDSNTASLNIIEDAADLSNILEDFDNNSNELMQDNNFDTTGLDILSENTEVIPNIQSDSDVEYLSETEVFDMDENSNVNSDFMQSNNDISMVNDEIDKSSEITNSYEDNEYSTNTEPSLQEIDLDFMDSDDNNNIENTFNDLAKDFDVQDDVNEEQYTNMEDVQETLEEQTTGINENKNDDIDTLFVEEANNSSTNKIETNESTTVKKKSSIPTLLILATLLSAGIYYGYQVYSQHTDNNELQNGVNQTEIPAQKPVSKEEAMPVETVENVEPAKQEELSAESVPYIEKNIDTSVVVENLHVDWEVPGGYTSNVNAKRYLTKLGKVLQLNLKTELMLLTKTPITNKISVELQFNKSTQKFEVKQVIASSQEKEVDDVIVRTVNSALGMNISTNMNIFNNIAGNPILVIHL